VHFTSRSDKDKIQQTNSRSAQNAPEVVALTNQPSEKIPYCYFCHGRDDLACCSKCRRHFHLRCIGMKARKDMKNWKCRGCSGDVLCSSAFHKKHCLREWYFKSIVKIDGSFSIVIEGVLSYNESIWRCSPIHHLLDKTHFVTINNSIYTLIVLIDC